MNHRKSIIDIALGSLLMLMTSGLVSAQEKVNHDGFARLLAQYVNNGIVNYKGFKAAEGQLDAYLERLARVKPDALDRQESMAFYMNLYNAWTIKLILSRYPDVRSIKDLGSVFQSPWKKKIVRLNGELVTLDHIEHDILRPRFKDPRVHFAINCAAKSCPPLLAEPYTGAQLDRQLDQVAGAFINDTASNYLKGDALYVSRIFKWFGKDFGYDIIGFFERYAQGDLKQKLAQNKGSLKVNYLDYDWSLNGT